LASLQADQAKSSAQAANALRACLPRIPHLQECRLQGYNSVTVANHVRTSSLDKLSQPVEQISRLIDRLAFQANRTAKSSNSDAVHDLRVAIRRLEQALVTFRVHLPRKQMKRIRKQLKAVLSCAGALRDYDVAARILSRIGQPAAAALHREVRARRKDAEKALLVRLKRLSLRTRVWRDDLKLNAPQTDFHARMLGTMARSAMPRLAQSFFEAGEAAATHGSAERLHDFRILVKKFRYTLELFVPIYGSLAEGWMREIRLAQSILGAINDYHSVLSIAADAGCDNKLQAALKKSERRKIRQFRAIWSERFSGPVSARWVRALRGSGEGRSIVRKPITGSTVAAQEALAARA
jgi:CHAD domain-containing protein